MIFWCLIVAGLPALVVLLRARRLDHVVFFSAGYLYYWILPVLVGKFPDMGSSSDIAFETWAGMFAHIPSARLYTYVISTVLYWSCFLLGDFWAQRVKRRRLLRVEFSLQFVPVLYVVLFIASAIFTYRMRWAIGSEYGALAEVAVAKGTLTAMSLSLLALALLKVLQQRPKTVRELILNRWMFGYLLIALALFGMGQRLYFVTSIFMILSYRSLFIKPFTGIQLATGGIIAAAAAGIMGLVRLRADVSAVSLLQNLAYEPVFTSFSLVSFLQENHIPWIESSRLLVTDILNLIPTAIFPNKADLLLDPAKAGYWFTSPLGALNSWVSFMINFGLFGTAPVMAAIGYGLRRLFLRSDSPVGRSQYLMCSAFTVFTFFRDPFSVSIVKNMLEFSILVPLGAALVSTWVVWSTRERSAGFSATSSQVEAS